MEERLIEIFNEYLPAWSWEEWQAAGSSDKEDIVINALADLGPDMPIEVDEAYDLFWDWAAGLTEADFGSSLQEANKVVRGAAKPWYSGGFVGLNDIDTRVTDVERERVARENEERRAKQAELEAERKARAKEKNKQLAIQRAEDAIAKGVIDEYNEAYRVSILNGINSDVYPAIDPETKELVFDMAEKKRILDPITQRVEAEKEAKKAAEKEAAKKAAERRAAEKPITYYLYPEVVINGETMRSPSGTRVVGQDNLVRAAKEVAREELKWINTERKFYVAGGHPFNWDGVIAIICENPDGTEEPFRTFRVRTNEGLKEAVRVVSDPDVLYHATEVGPFYDILNSGVMLHDVRNEGGVHAICFTTDDNYTIYGYPCKIKFSRSKLEQGGYDLYPVDEFEDYGDGESEERIDEDINDVRKYVTEVIVDWEFIAVAQDGDDYRLSTGEYDEEGNESDNWDLKLSDFRALLDSLKASGIKVTEKGQPEANDDYWFDENGEFRYSEKELAFA
jgi:hypothetical protein